MTDLSHFDPNAASNPNNNIFGLPFTEEDARLVILPVPWEVTVSYNAGTARATEHVCKASLQVDLFDADAHDAADGRCVTVALRAHLFGETRFEIRDRREEGRRHSRLGLGFAKQRDQGRVTPKLGAGLWGGRARRTAARDQEQSQKENAPRPHEAGRATAGPPHKPR